MLLITQSLQQVNLGVLGVVSLGPPLIFVVSQQALYVDWKKRMSAMPLLFVIGTGLTWSNARAAVRGFLMAPLMNFCARP